LTKAREGDHGRRAAKRRLLARTRDITPQDAQAMLSAREIDWQQPSTS